jgi:hypothetical protein
MTGAKREGLAYTTNATHFTALELATDLEAMVTYDKRLGEAAEAAGLTWAAPI